MPCKPTSNGISTNAAGIATNGNDISTNTEEISPAATGTSTQLTTAVGRGQDAYIQRALIDDGHVSSTMLMVKNCIAEWKNNNWHPKDWDRKAYLRFDLSLVDSSTIDSAELILNFAPTGYGFASRVPDATFAVYGLTDESLDNWMESELQWNNAPANGQGSAEVRQDKSALLGKFILPQGQSSGPFGIAGSNLAELIRADTNGLLTLIVVRETTSTGPEGLVHGFASRRHQTLPPPTLRLSTDRP